MITASKSLALVFAVVAWTMFAGAVRAQDDDECPVGTYLAASGDCVESPDANQEDVTAECADGTYSHSENRQGACSHHGGVKEWER